MLRLFTVLSLIASLVMLAGCSDDKGDDGDDSGGKVRLVLDASGNLQFADDAQKN
jgi:hypothetical protein